jgi:hypothetical protein
MTTNDKHVLIDMKEWPKAEVILAAAERLEKDAISLTSICKTEQAKTYERAADFLRYLVGRIK